MKKVITTVGTSLVTNYMSEDVQLEFKMSNTYKDIKDGFEKLNNKSSLDYDSPKYARYIKKIKEVLLETWLKRIKKYENEEGNSEERYTWEIDASVKLNVDCCAEIKTI